MKFTVLGCGGSSGVPAAGGFWGACDPEEPRNRRTRASLLVQSDTTNLVVDPTPDLRYHLNKYSLQSLAGLLVTHAHSDHVNGIDDIKHFSHHGGKMMDVYSTVEVLDEIKVRWPYVFEALDAVYKPFAVGKVIETYDSFEVNDILIQTFEQDHMTCRSVGYRFGDFAYSVDMCFLEHHALEALEGVKVWVVDACGFHRKSPLSHATLDLIYQWVDVLKPEMTYLTVLSGQMDYQTLCNELPPHIRPAYDGLVIEL